MDDEQQNIVDTIRVLHSDSDVPNVQAIGLIESRCNSPVVDRDTARITRRAAFMLRLSDGPGSTDALLANRYSRSFGNANGSPSVLGFSRSLTGDGRDSDLSSRTLVQAEHGQQHWIEGLDHALEDTAGSIGTPRS